MSAPTLPTGHDDFEMLAVAWALSALEPEEQARFEAHSETGCRRCAATVRAVREIGLELAFAVPDVEPPPDLRGRLLAAAFATRAAGSEPELALPVAWIAPEDAPAAPAAPEPRPGSGTAGRHAADRGDGADELRRGRQRRADSRGGTRRRLVAALAAAALVGVSAVTTWQVVGRDAGPVSVAAGKRVVTLTADGGGTVATVVLTGDRADVVTDTLLPNTGRDSQFVLWGVPPDGAGVPKALGSFDVTAEGLHSYSVRLTQAAGDYPVYAVSEEPAGALPAVPSRIVARGAVS